MSQKTILEDLNCFLHSISNSNIRKTRPNESDSKKSIELYNKSEACMLIFKSVADRRETELTTLFTVWIDYLHKQIKVQHREYQGVKPCCDLFTLAHSRAIRCCYDCSVQGWYRIPNTVSGHVTLECTPVPMTLYPPKKTNNRYSLNWMTTLYGR
jgi:hypothetical protein